MRELKLSRAPSVGAGKICRTPRWVRELKRYQACPLTIILCLTARGVRELKRPILGYAFESVLYVAPLAGCVN